MLVKLVISAKSEPDSKDLTFDSLQVEQASSLRSEGLTQDSK